MPDTLERLWVQAPAPQRKMKRKEGRKGGRGGKGGKEGMKKEKKQASKEAGREMDVWKGLKSTDGEGTRKQRKGKEKRKEE